MFGIKNPFKKEKTENVVKTPSIEQPLPSITEISQQSAAGPEKLKESNEVEVLIAKIDTLKFQYEALKGKIEKIEKMIEEIYQIAKRSSS